MSRLWSVFLLVVFVLALLSYMLLAFAYRDYSHLLLAQTFLTLLGIVVSIHYFSKPNLRHLFVSKSEDTGQLSHIWIEEEDGLEVTGRFCIND